MGWAIKTRVCFMSFLIDAKLTAVKVKKVLFLQKTSFGQT